MRLVDFKSRRESMSVLFGKCLTEKVRKIVSRADFHSFELGIRSEVKPIQNEIQVVGA